MPDKTWTAEDSQKMAAEADRANKQIDEGLKNPQLAAGILFIGRIIRESFMTAGYKRICRHLMNVTKQ